MYREYRSLFFRIEISFLERRAVNFYAFPENGPPDAIIYDAFFLFEIY